MSTGNTRPFRPAVDRLEAREVPAITYAAISGGVVTVNGDATDESFTVARDGSYITVSELVSGNTQSFLASKVSRVQIFAGQGNDSITVPGTVGVQLWLYGGKGNDTVQGGAGPEVIYGGAGNDVLNGGGGRDAIYGQDDDDYITGGDGRDVLFGGAGNDTVNGGAGTDGIIGGAGNDVLIGIDDATTDTLDAGTGTDVLWLDQSGGFRDAVTGIDGADFLRAVAAFANGADKTFDGDDIADPALPTGSYQYEAFDDRQLFAVGGPSVDDVRQSFAGTGATFTPALNDAWLLAGAGSMVESYPTLITTNMVDFGDGTFGVRLNGAYFRVDSDLPVVRFGDLTPAFARLGTGDSMWVPLLEKVFATALVPATPSYALLANPALPAVPTLDSRTVFQAFGAVVGNVQIPGGFGQANQLANYIGGVLADNISVTLTVTTAAAGIPLLPGQTYTVVAVGINASGAYTLTLRNPFGVDGAGSTDAAPLDGFVTVPIAAGQFSPPPFNFTGTLSLGDFNSV